MISGTILLLAQSPPPMTLPARAVTIEANELSKYDRLQLATANSVAALLEL